MSNSSDSRLYFEGVLDKAGKRFFEVSCVVNKCTHHSGINYYVGRLISMIKRKKECVTHKKQLFLYIRKRGVTIY